MNDDTQKMYIKSDTPTPVAPSADQFVTLTAGGVARAFGVGVLTGLVTVGLFYALDHFIFGAALCRSGVQGCSSAPTYSAIVATVVGVIAGIVALAKAGIYRPLPTAIAVGFALWGMFGLLNNNVVWYWGLIVGVVLYGLAYMLFAWLSRIRSFLLSLVLLAAVAVLIRFVIG